MWSAIDPGLSLLRAPRSDEVFIVSSPLGADEDSMEADDRGSSLIEAVVGIALLGLVLVGVVDAAWTNTRVAASTRQRSMATAILDDAVRSLRAAPYTTCPHIDGSYAQLLQTADFDDDSMTIEIASYQFWKESSQAWVEFGDHSIGECTSSHDLAHDFSVQRIEVTIVDDTGPITSRGVVKTRAPQL